MEENMHEINEKIEYMDLKMPKLEVVEDKAAMNWLIHQLDRADTMYAPKENWFLRYMPYILNAMTAGVFIMAIIFFMNGAQIVSGNLATAAQINSQAIEKIASFITSGNTISGQPPV